MAVNCHITLSGHKSIMIRWQPTSRVIVDISMHLKGDEALISSMLLMEYFNYICIKMIEQDRNAFKHISPCHIPCNSNISTSSVLPHSLPSVLQYHQEQRQHIMEEKEWGATSTGWRKISYIYGNGRHTEISQHSHCQSNFHNLCNSWWQIKIL